MNKKIVYISSPYSIGDVKENVRQGFLVADRLLELGFLPYPPLYTHYWDEITSRSWDEWMLIDREWILKCDCLLRVPGKSIGADMEVEWAKENGIPVYFSIEELSCQEGNCTKVHKCYNCGL
jgi:hypothetical protein